MEKFIAWTLYGFFIFSAINTFLQVGKPINKKVVTQPIAVAVAVLDLLFMYGIRVLYLH